MLKAVVFDLFETLVTQAGCDVPRASSLGQSLGLDAAAYRPLWKRRRPRVIIGELSFRRALTEIGSELGVAIAHDRLTGACDARAGANAKVFGRIRPDILALTRELRSAGLVLGVISNCVAEDVAAWSHCELAPQFSCQVWSFSAGRAKPDPLIYREATGLLGVPLGETLFVGDGDDDELGGAGRAGLQVAQAGWFVSRPVPPGILRLRAPEDVRRLVARSATAVNTNASTNVETVIKES